MSRKDKNQLEEALREYVGDMELVEFVRPVHMGLLVKMRSGAELHVQVTILKEAK